MKTKLFAFVRPFVYVWQLITRRKWENQDPHGMRKFDPHNKENKKLVQDLARQALLPKKNLVLKRHDKVITNFSEN